jgi:SPP1 family predicted phage head-tail adaptor
MRAGSLDKTITIERATEAVDANGVLVSTWTTFATVRAQLVEPTTDEVVRDQGAVAESTAVFKTWFVEDVRVADRVTYAGRHYDVKQVRELGRREALEIRTVARAA